MNVFRVQGDISNFPIVDCKLTLKEKLPILESFRQFRPLSPTWKLLECSKVGDGPLGHFSEFSLIGGMPVVFAEILAISEIERFIGSAGELLPISVDGRNAFALNVTRTLDACDRQKSRMHELPDGQPTTHWPIFRRSSIGGTGLFRIKEAQSCLYIAEPADGTGFYALYQRRGLTGLVFEEQPLSE
jgi:hypothetical protein